MVVEWEIEVKSAMWHENILNREVESGSWSVNRSRECDVKWVSNGVDVT